ncbi:hypothetical protein E2C01_082852 [Portunus trituberculatus]|uniref:Uncharacterized protein n=1 Tax=Portunus trituberculatus TaxID=210409 RepID=A0A5B7J1X5_PORTR|nr:hypothetical protein [Portunus trituberculatus]
MRDEIPFLTKTTSTWTRFQTPPLPPPPPQLPPLRRHAGHMYTQNIVDKGVRKKKIPQQCF